MPVSLQELLSQLNAPVAEPANPLRGLIEGLRQQEPESTNTIARIFGMQPQDQQRAIKGYTYTGRPVLQNEDDGSVSTEQSVTITDPRLNGGKFTNIPSIWGGRRYDEDAAAALAVLSGTPYDSFDSVEAAERAAEARTEKLGVELDEGRWWEGRIPTPKRRPQGR